MRIYLNMCCYNRPYDYQAQTRIALESQAKLHIQSMIKEGRYDLVSSYTLDYEVSRNPFDMRRSSIQSFIASSIKAYVSIEREAVIGPLASEIMETGVKEKDALHLASAIYACCTYFISTDIRLLKYKTDRIKLVTPVEFIMETEGEQ